MDYKQLIQQNPELYFSAIMVVVGALMRGVKRLPFVKSDMLPALAFIFGWAIDAGISNTLLGYSYTAAGLTALAGGIAGLGAAGGHEALMRTAKLVGLDKLAEKLLGNAQNEKKKRTTSAMIVFLVLLAGCGGALGTAAKTAHLVGDALGMIDGIATNTQKYFDRHPSMEREEAIGEAIKLVRDAVKEENREQAKDLYGRLRHLLIEYGVPSATPPDGGAETDAPDLQPFELPTVEEFEAAL